MAIRQIRVIGDEILNKECKPVKEMTDRTRELIEDMFETMYEANGVGLAAPQVGILKQIIVMDVDDGNQYVLINPEIIEESGSQTGPEGCLSVPNKSGQVTSRFAPTMRIWSSLSLRETSFSPVASAMSAIICTVTSM